MRYVWRGLLGGVAIACALLFVGCERRAESEPRNVEAESAESPPDDAHSSSTPADASSRPFLRFTSPLEDASVVNPVTFRFEGDGSHRAVLLVDGAPVTQRRFDPDKRSRVTDTVDPDVSHTAEIVGYGPSGAPVARDSVHFRIDPARDAELVGSFWNSYYFVPVEQNYYGGAAVILRDLDCHELARVPEDFVREVCLQGSGRLDPDGLVSLGGECECGTPCPNGSEYCFTRLDSERYPWGAGPDLEPTRPLRTWAVDPDIIPHGSVVFAEEWDGMWIPKVGELGGFNHDGCFVAQDLGGSIHGDQVDIFTGSREMWRRLEELFPTRSELTVYLDAPRCTDSPAADLTK